MWESDDDSDDTVSSPVHEELDHGHTHGYTRGVHPIGNMDRRLPQGYTGGIRPEGYTEGRYLPGYTGQEHTQIHMERVHNTQYTEQEHPQEYTGWLHTPKTLEVLDAGRYIGGVHTPKTLEVLDAGRYIGGVHTPKTTGGIDKKFPFPKTRLLATLGKVHTPTKCEMLPAEFTGGLTPKEYTGMGRWDGNSQNNQGRPSTEKQNDGNNINEVPPNIQKSALPNNWSEHIDRGSGKFYYYNCVSKVSQWEKPREWINRTLVDGTPKTQLPDPHLENWKQQVLMVIPDVELQFLESRLRANSGLNAVNLVCEELLETLDYPKSLREPAENVVKPEEEKMECDCCCTEHAFEDMVQCTEGHLFCTDCLHRLVTAAADGSGKTNLSCMSTNGCQGTYPQSVIEKAVPNETLRRYEERVREENLNRAGMSNLVRCPHCNYAAVMENDDTTFPCQNKQCMKVTCRHCKEDWNNHVGLTCDQLEKKDETKLRKRYEERMTQAKVRTCHGCKTKFTKEGKDCNKMTCNCGATMCYVCRAPDIGYEHFCQHLREPGKRCTQCTGCSLWTNPDEDDERAIKWLKRRAQKRRKEEGYDDYKAIGAPSEPKAKKIRRH